MPSHPEAERSKRRYVLRRALALVIGTVLSLVLLEGTLWTIYAFNAPPDRLAQLRLQPGVRRILCLGDSNTYGIGLKADESYPGRLQRYLDRDPENPWEVINLGYPGQNTAQMRYRLAENLAAYEPEIVVFWGGMNNSWSPAMAHLWEHPDTEPRENEAASGFDRAVRHSRALKALSKIRADLLAGGGAAAVQVREGDDTIPGLDGAMRGEGLGDVETVDSSQDKRGFNIQEIHRHILTDLRRVHAICDEHDTELVLVNYFADIPWVDGKINHPIRSYGEHADLPVIDMRAELLQDLYDQGIERTVQAVGWHATAYGNLGVAQVVLRNLMELGLLEERDAWTDVPTLAEVGERPFCEMTQFNGRSMDLEIAGRVDWIYGLHLSALMPNPDGGELLEVAVPSNRITTLGKAAETYAGHIDKRCYVRTRIHLPRIRSDETILGWRWYITTHPPKGVDEPVRTSLTNEVLFADHEPAE